jgi:hypothetical protein
VTAATPGQAACEAAGENWAGQGPERRGKWEAVAAAARDHRGELPPDCLPPEEAYSPEETAYEAFTARLGPQRIAWEALSPEKRADWRAVVHALAKRGAR